MSALLQTDDFATAPASPTWTAVASTFSSDGTRAICPTGAVEGVALLSATDPVLLLSASTPQKLRYELDVFMPATVPATGTITLGLLAFGRSNNRDGFWLTYRRSSGGASNVVDLSIRRPLLSTAADLSLYSIATVALAVNESMRLRLDVTILGNAVIATAYRDDVILFTSTPTIGLFNSITGRSLASFSAATGYAGLVAQVASVTPWPPVNNPPLPDAAHLDRLRVYDDGSLTAVPALYPAPTLTAEPTLTPITLSAEDDGTAATLSVQPSYPVDIIDGWEVIDHPYDGGYTASHARQTRNRRTFPMTWNALSAADIASLQALRGSAPFSWTSRETGEVVRLQWVTDLTEHHVGPGVWAAEATAREIFSDA